MTTGLAVCVALIRCRFNVPFELSWLRVVFRVFDEFVHDGLRGRGR